LSEKRSPCERGLDTRHTTWQTHDQALDESNHSAVYLEPELELELEPLSADDTLLATL